MNSDITWWSCGYVKSMNGKCHPEMKPLDLGYGIYNDLDSSRGGKYQCFINLRRSY